MKSFPYLPQYSLHSLLRYLDIRYNLAINIIQTPCDWEVGIYLRPLISIYIKHPSYLPTIILHINYQSLAVHRTYSLVLYPARNDTDSTAYFAICRVVATQRCLPHRIPPPPCRLTKIFSTVSIVPGLMEHQATHILPYTSTSPAPIEHGNGL